MDYKVVVTAEAEEDLNQFIQYLLFAKKNKQENRMPNGNTVKHGWILLLFVSLYITKRSEAVLQ